MKNMQYTIIGTAPEGDEVAHVIYRLRMNMMGTDIEELETISLKRSGDSWRLLLSGDIKNTAEKIKQAFADFDAERRFDTPESAAKDVRGCECPAILRGAKRPSDCKLFGRVCSPENPMGSCMVSSEGTCAAWYRHERLTGANK